MTWDPEACVGAADHSPRAIATERHHIFPKYLCALAGLAIRHELAPLCGTCHENVHHAIHHLLATGTVGGHLLAPGSRQLVYAWWAWWQGVLV